MSDEKWGVGDAKDSKAFDTITIHGKSYELIHGEHPHSRRDNNMYARDKNNNIISFDGHRRPFKIEIEEYNYLKESELSGDEIRKGCSVKVYVGGIQVLDEFHRNYEAGYLKAHNFILSMEMNWSWFPSHSDKYIGKTVAYNDQICKINRFIISQSCMMIERMDGKPFKRELWESEDDYEAEKEIKIEINSPNITWHFEI